MRLFHEGQFEGRKVRLPVFLGRRPSEPVDKDLRSFYKSLLETVDTSSFREGQWNLCDRTGWPDNASFQNLVAWSWLKGDQRYLIIVNLSDSPVQARVQVRWANSGGKWRLIDKLSEVIYERDADEMLRQGLYVELGPWGCHFFECQGSPKI